MSTAIDAFDRLLAHGTGPLSQLAQRGLWLGEPQPRSCKRFFIRRAFGLTRGAARGGQACVTERRAAAPKGHARPAKGAHITRSFCR